MEEAFVAAAFRSGADAIVVVDETGEIVAANPCAEDLLGVDDLVGERVEQFVPVAARGVHAAHRKVFDEKRKPRRMGQGLDLFARRSDGKQFPVDISLTPVLVDGESYVVASLRDVTALVEARAELESNRAQLAIMDDRQRIARDLHDTVIQDIFAAGLSLQAVQAQMVDPDASVRITAAVQQLDAAIARLRRVIFDLRARSGEDVEWQLQRVVSHLVTDSGIVADVETEGPLDVLSARTLEHLFATVREAVANVVRHAEATRTSVEVAVGSGECVLVVTDDGTGMTDAPGVGFGLDNMANRAEALGGEFSIRDRDEGGSIVTWRVPMATKSVPRS